MKRLLFVCCLLVSFACTKELATESAPEESGTVLGSPESELAQNGTFAVKLSPEGARAVEAAKARVPRTREGVPTRSGVAAIDQALGSIGAVRFERIVSYDPEWEAAYDQTGINRWYRVRFDERIALAEAGELLAAQPGVAVVEYTINPKYRRPLRKGPARPFRAEHAVSIPESRVAGPAMNDPLLKHQWHYDNPGPAGYDQFIAKPIAGADINLYDAWELCKGREDIIVAVIDEPVQTTHPDLAANMWSNPSNPGEHGYNFWNRTPKLDWTTPFYNNMYQEWEYADHGSHVAGVIAAVNNNGVGVSGIAGGDNGHGVKIMSCQIMGNNTANVDSDADIKAFEYAWKNGAVIAQNSWGYSNQISPGYWEGNAFKALRDAIDTFVKIAGSKNPASPISGGLVIFAAGNEGDIHGDAAIYPAAYAPAIAVASMDWRFLPAYYTDYGSWADVTAPGGDAVAGLTSSGTYKNNSLVLSTILCDDAIDFKDGRKGDGQMYGYGFMQGTSMASPHVSGVAALGLAYASQLGKKYTAEEFKSLLLSSVYGIDSYFIGNKRGDGTTMYLKDYKGKMGGGCVDALKLLLAIKGTSAVYVKTGAASAVDFARYFGGSGSKVTLKGVDILAADKTKLGMSSNPTVGGSKITFNCSAPGTAFVTVHAVAGDTSISREFALVSRAGLAENGGWL